MTNPKTRNAAIAAMCKQCIYDPLSAGTWREQCSACPSTNCPLHAFRPLSGNARTPEGLAKLRDDLERRNANR